jgi:hypothetical protein
VIARTCVRMILAMAAAAWPAGPAGAQVAEYRRTIGDTLRYRNVTKMEGMVHGAAGDEPFNLSRTATFAFTFAGGEDVTAWYDTLAIETSGSLAGEKSRLEALVRAPFHLRMAPNGRVLTVKAPDLPRAARLFAELPPQLDDFFPRLPVSGKMPIGTTWTDTSTRSESDSAGHHLLIRRIGHSRAVRDSIVDGVSTVVITQHVMVSMTSSAPMRTQPYVAALSLTGDEDGVALFSVAEGRLISRDRSGELRGQVTYRGGDQPWVVNQTYRYHRTDVLETPTKK